jgi:hypothetical protein
MWLHQRWMIALAQSKGTVMTGNAINAKSVRELSAEALDAVAGGWFPLPLRAFTQIKGGEGGQGGQGGPMGMLNQIMQQAQG